MSHLATHLAKHHLVSLLTLENERTPSFYPLPPSAQHIRLDKLGGNGLERFRRVISRPGLVRRQVQRIAPDVIISFMDTMNITALISCLGLKIPIIVSERNDPSLHRIGLGKQMARSYAYPFARLIVVQTRRVASYFSNSLQSKIRIIANPIYGAPVSARPELANAEGRKRIIAVGRLVPQKGFRQLIDAFAFVAADWPCWDLVIIGEGPERHALEGCIRRYGLEGRIHLKGLIADVYSELAASHLIAFPSHYEGFPNALAEGLAAGLPAVGFADVSGVEELILHEKTGLLIDQGKGMVGFAKALSVLMSDAHRRKEMGCAARNHVDHWAPHRIFEDWEEVLVEATERRTMNAS
jgi:glycosyltransferase involved in cell wall biosynthesis